MGKVKVEQAMSLAGLMAGPHEDQQQSQPHSDGPDLLHRMKAMAITTVDVFTAITDPERRALLTLLLQGDQTVHALAVALDRKRPQVAAQLQILCAADLVAVRWVGKQCLYSLQHEGLNPLYDWLQQCIGDVALP